MKTKLVILDTSVWILALRQQAKDEIRQQISHILENMTVAINPLIKLELLGGARTINEFERLKSRLNGLVNFPFTETIWQQAANLSFSLRRKGLTVPYTDILICQTALSYKAVLYHVDYHFDLVAQHEPLKSQNLLKVTF